tara:strand:- start:24 stop:569 length:546 start_codon:yes stop_codon:yes gene_type:complete
MPNYLSLERLVNSTEKATHEKGGSFNKKLQFKLTSTASFNSQNGRQFVYLPSDPFVWHTHPINQGFWPSYEDLTTAIRQEHRIHLIITAFGVWILKPVRRNLFVDKSWFDNINNYLVQYTTSDENWPLKVQPLIEDIMKQMKPVLDVTFFDFGIFRGRTLNRNLSFYIREVEQHIIRLITA